MMVGSKLGLARPRDGTSGADREQRLRKVGEFTFEDDTTGLKYGYSSSDDFTSQVLFFAYRASARRDGESFPLEGPGWSAKAVTHDIVWLQTDKRLYHKHSCLERGSTKPATREIAIQRGFSACAECSP